MIISIDPGVTACGVSVVSYKDGKLKVHETVNVKGTLKLRGEHGVIGDKFGKRTGKVYRIADTIKDMVARYKEIDYIVMEAPFYNRRAPQAFASLLEVVYGIKYIVSFILDIQMFVIAPMAIKKLWTNIGNCGKEPMLEHMGLKVKSGDVTLPKDRTIDSLSEHEIDSVACGWAYHKLKELKDEELIKQDI